MPSLNPVPNAHVCVYLMIHITKLQLQTTFPEPLYIPHSRMYSSGPWPLKSCWVCCWYILISKSWGCPPLGPGIPFLDSDTCAEGGFFISARVFFPVWCHPWMNDETNGWNDGWTGHVMKKASRKTTMTSFTICNIYIFVQMFFLDKTHPNLIVGIDTLDRLQRM